MGGEEGRHTDGMDCETARPGRADCDGILAVGVEEGRRVCVVGGAARADALVLIPAVCPGYMQQVRSALSSVIARTGVCLSKRTRCRTDDSQRSGYEQQGGGTGRGRTRISWMAFVSGPTDGLPLLNLTRAMSMAVRYGSEMEVRKRRTKAQRRKMTPGMWNTRGMSAGRIRIQVGHVDSDLE